MKANEKNNLVLQMNDIEILKVNQRYFLTVVLNVRGIKVPVRAECIGESFTINAYDVDMLVRDYKLTGEQIQSIERRLTDFY